MIEGQKRPFVDELKCNGCGICEQVCPIEGESAIEVEPMGQIRLREGSYIAAAKIMNLELKPKAERDMLEEPPAVRFSPSQKEKSSLPPGFIP